MTTPTQPADLLAHVEVLREMLANEYAQDESVGMVGTTLERAALNAAIESLESLAAHRGEAAGDDPTMIAVLQEITRIAEKLDGDCEDCYHVACVANGALARIGVWHKSSLGFGDFVHIEQKRHGVPNEIYLHKVVGTLRSNAWVDVPVQSPATEVLHAGDYDVVACICCGVDEREVRRYRLADVRPAHPPQAQAGAGDAWLPIESAPIDDRTQILAYVPSKETVASMTAGFARVAGATVWQPLPAPPALEARHEPE